MRKYSESEFYGYTNGKLIWFAYDVLPDILMDAVFSECRGCAEIEEREHCDRCIAYKAEPILEKQIIDEGIKLMTSLAKEWRKTNRQSTG